MRKRRPVPRANDPNFMLSLARGLSVIRAFASDQPRLSIAEAARLTGLSRAAARRCFHTLETLGYATGENGSFELTAQILSLSYAYLESAPIARCAQPVLERLVERLNESCSVAVLDRDEIVYIGRAATRRILSIGLSVGSRLPAYCTSMGRTLLAGMTDAQLAAYLDRVRLVRRTEYTITSAARLRAELDRIRAAGYALVDQELELGLRSIAVPIHRPDGTVAASLNSGVTTRIDRRTMERDFLPALKAAAQEVAFGIRHVL